MVSKYEADCHSSAQNTSGALSTQIQSENLTMDCKAHQDLAFRYIFDFTSYFFPSSHCSTSPLALLQTHQATPAFGTDWFLSLKCSPSRYSQGWLPQPHSLFSVCAFPTILIRIARNLSPNMLFFLLCFFPKNFNFWYSPWFTNLLCLLSDGNNLLKLMQTLQSQKFFKICFLLWYSPSPKHIVTEHRCDK